MQDLELGGRDQVGINANNHSIIDPTDGVELNWFTTGDEHHTGSDHAAIVWEILGLGEKRGGRQCPPASN